MKQINNWSDFEDYCSTLPNTTEQGKEFAKLVKLFLQQDPKYQVLLKNVWHHYEVPQRIRKKVHLPEADMGVDLLCETKTGEFWTVQEKYQNVN